ncbi:hypothetical protein JJE00_03435 [Candidatus Bathyarchaeota archaeon]|nr:hypothetical protein [Candidatus Bathyarchaeota archaeon]
MMMNTKAISYFYVIIGLASIIAGIVIGILANIGLFEQTITSEVLPLFNTYVIGSIVAFILVLIGILVLVFGHRS